MMLQNYFKIGIRHLLKNKTYVFINIVGLGVSIAMCIVAYLNWKFDADYDKFHTKADQIYKINTIKESTKQVYGLSPAPLKELVKNDIAGVKDAVAIDIWGMPVNVGDQSFYEEFVYTESNFLEWFDFPLIRGEARLDDPSTVLITERVTKKYFGDQDPIGKTITIYTEPERQRELTITGVLKTPPKNSSIYFDFVANNDNQIFRNGERLLDEKWDNWREAIFLILDKPEEANQIESQLNQYVAPHNAAQKDFGTHDFSLYPLKDLAHRAKDIRWNSLMQSTPPSAIWGNIVMAILLLLTSCLNFANMTVSFAGKRLKEIGIRKVVGGNQMQLISQLLVESFLITLLGLGFGLIAAEWIVDWYNHMWRFIDLEISLLDNWPLIAFLAGTVLVTTLLAGAYPAFYISSFNPNSIFHGSVKFGGSNLVSRVLLGIQVAISLTTLVAGLSFARNADFQETTDLGFKRDGIQAVYTGNEQTFTVLNNAIRTDRKIVGTAGVRSHIGDSCPRYEFELKGEKHESEYMEVGDGYLDLMEIKTISGRAFNPDLNTDYETAIMINEKFVQNFFPNSNPVGQTVTFFDTLHCTIIGVVANFMQDSFADPTRPLALRFSKPNRYLYLAVRTEPEDMMDTKAVISSAWKKHFPSKPFEHYFQADFLANTMEVTQNIKTTTLMLAIFTFLLTISGLLALMSLNILKRIKEIAVRRVLGASTINIAFILNQNYFWIIFGGILIGCGGGAFLSIKLLDSIYSIHAGISSFMMVLAGIIAFVVVFMAIGIKLFQVMKMNPAEVLKKE